MNIKIFATIGLYAFIAVALASCKQIQTYKDVSGDAVAKLRLKMEQPIVSNLFLRSVDVESCQLGSGFSWLTGGVDSLYAKKIGMLDESPPTEGILEYVIAAGKPIAVITVMHNAKANFSDVMFGLTPSQQEKIRSKQPGICEAPAFMPEKGRQYEITYRAAPGSCATHIYRLSRTAGVVTRTEITNSLNIKVRASKGGTLSCSSP